MDLKKSTKAELESKRNTFFIFGFQNQPDYVDQQVPEAQFPLTPQRGHQKEEHVELSVLLQKQGTKKKEANTPKETIVCFL